MKKHAILIIFLLSLIKLNAQEWRLKLNSSVELRTFKLTNKSDISESKLAGATIALFKGSTLVNQIQSDGNGDFVIDVPANGEYVLAVSYSGCNTKKFMISTMNVPSEVAKDDYKPSFGIEGVIMAKAFPTIDYSILKQPLVKIVYTSNGKKFDDEQSYTNQILGELSRIRDAEDVIINNFTSTNNIGNVALSKGDCPLAKSSYEKAMTIIPGERYPSEQLAKVGDCFKAKELAEKKAQDEANAKANEAKLAAEKAEVEKLAKQKAASDKAEADKLAKQKEASDKAEADNLAKQKVEAGKIEASKLATEKAEAEKLAKQKVETDKIEASKIATEKAEVDKLAKQKEASDKAEAEKLAKQKVEAGKIEASKLATEKADADKLSKQKEASDKTEADKLAKQKTESDKSQTTKLATEKVEADKLAKEKSISEKEQKYKQAKEKAESDRLANEKIAADKKQADQTPKKKTETDKIVKETTTAPAKEQSNGLIPNGSGAESGSSGVNNGDAKYSIPQALGSDKYKATIKRADELFKMKRYAEAKPMYEDALKLKANDIYAANKLAEIEKLIVKK